MIKINDKLYMLETEHTSYCFHITETGLLEHLYYGPRLEGSSPDLRPDELVCALAERHAFPAGNLISLDQQHPAVTPEDLCLELSGCGKGDIREPFIELIFADGSRTSDFRFQGAVSGKLPSAGSNQNDGWLQTDGSNHNAGSPDNADSNRNDAGTDVQEEQLLLPHAYDETGKAERLIVTLQEQTENLRLDLVYDIFPECDVICRFARLYNESGKTVRIARLMSTQLDFARDDLNMRSFHGAWAREMNPVDVPVRAGKYVVSSVCGASSNRANPFVMLYPDGANEESGLCYGFNLVYSGNHYEAAEVSAFGKTRFVSGINPAGFLWQLKTGGYFDSPQAVMTVSGNGFRGMSTAMHAFVREHIVRGTWKRKARPVVLNSWEASYFDINERKLLRLARKAKEAGIELFVMDDGWFGRRDDDTTSLGDWTVNTRKLPNGLKGLAEKIRALGLDFGIWVEPEMVSADSDLYRAHPAWVMEIPGREHAEGRNQRILDLANPAVVEYLTAQMENLFASAEIAYVKWDMNRIFSDVYSKAFPPEQQGEIAHRYICGLYRMMQTLTERFPELLFEGCAAGGNRFDLGILSYFPQIWASDNTDPAARAAIQEGYSYGYPPSVISCHVSDSPNHQTLRETSLETRFETAAFGILGYECNLADLPEVEFRKIKEQTALYKQWRELFQYGSFYRVSGNRMQASPAHAAHRSWIVVSEDRSRAAGLLQQEQVTPNAQYAVFQAAGLDPEKQYAFYNIPHDVDLMAFGSLINTQTPVHVKQNSALHRTIARFKSMPGEQETHKVSGAVLMRAGITLQPGFAGSGYDGNVRFFQDYASRMYFMEAVES
ncbi:MAG: alpha-galactosidase [Eubacterium sp.]|nr:alpha-galactosidase [Eubacterium sp.]